MGNLRQFLIHKNLWNGIQDKEEFNSIQEDLNEITLEQCLKHNSEQIRLNVLGYVVESKKSTLKFTKDECNYIILFLEYNLGERLEFLPLIKKALKRMKDSFVVMERELMKQEKKRDYEKKVNCMSDNYEKTVTVSLETSAKINEDIEIYNDFFEKLQALCLKGLCPDATFYRRRNSLQILCSMQDILDDILKSHPFNEKQADIIFKCLLLETYDYNKEMSFKILKTMLPTLLQLHLEKRVHELVSQGLELGNSIRPIDSITASYVLKISLLSPLIEDILCTHFNAIRLSNNIVEKEALLMIILLKERLKETLTLAKENIVLTVTKRSIYGYIYCIRSLLNDCNLQNAETQSIWVETIGELISICFGLNQAVSLIVNNSSPEGHLPMDLNPKHMNHLIGLPEREIVTPQMVLLCSWRTVKEVSLLFGEFAMRLPIRKSDCSFNLLTDKQIMKIGEHLVSLLSETKHRGAFEQAHVGFSQLCTRLWRLKKENLNELPKIWLHQILLTITGLAPGNSKLCATRRSAGVPFMIQALLSSEPNISNDSKCSAFHSVMKILLGLTELRESDDSFNFWKSIKLLIYKDTIFSQYENIFNNIESDVEDKLIEEQQVNVTEIKSHTLNILRALFRHSQLGDFVKTYVADGLTAAFKSYDAKTWAERNAATLLFSALMIRIFGVQRTKDHVNLTTANKMTGRMFFDKYPSLLPYVLDELQTFVSVDDGLIKPSVHSILLLLSRLYINPNSNADAEINWEINEFIDLVSQCAKSPMYKTRELAARALVPFLTEKSACTITKKLLSIIALGSVERLSLNAAHGYMLQVVEIMRKLQSTKYKSLKEDYIILVNETRWILESLETSNIKHACFPLAAVYINAISELFNTVDQSLIECFDLRRLFHTLKQHLTDHTMLKRGPGDEMYKDSAIKLITSAGAHSSVIKAVQDSMDIPARIHIHILNTVDCDLQAIGWLTINDAVKRTEKHEAKLLYSRAIDVARDCVPRLHNKTPELQDSVFNFLYEVLNRTDEYSNTPGSYNRLAICDLVLKKMMNNASNNYCERSAYKRLLGKAYTTMSMEFKNVLISLKCKQSVYANFCDQHWISSLDSEIVESVFDILYDLFRVNRETNDQYCTLEWWTVILQSLIDDRAEIQNEASRIFSKVNPQSARECRSAVLEEFFEKFTLNVIDVNPDAAIAALFCWGVVLLGDGDYEMDETDVFNKCNNYGYFEPVQISHACAQLLKYTIQKWRFENEITPIVKLWISSRLSVDLPENMSFRQLMDSYKNYIPILQGNLQDILDPTYKDKLLQILAYEEYRSLLDGQN